MKTFYYLKKTGNLMLLMLCAGSIVTIQAQTTWEEMNSMRETKDGFSLNVIDSMIYVFGGMKTNYATTAATEAYNTESGEWSDLASAPEAVSGAGTGVIDGKIYQTGGWTRAGSDWVAIASTYVYDPELNSWETKKACSKNIASVISCVLDGKFYVFGGLKDYPENDISGQRDVFAYDPAEDTWDGIPDMLYARAFGAQACIYNGQIYLFGGLAFISDNASVSTSIVSKAEKYDPGENTWTELEDLKVPVTGALSMVYNDRIYLFGGDSAYTQESGVCTNIIQEYDPATDQWRFMESMPFNRSSMHGGKVENFTYIFGGYPVNSREDVSFVDEVWRFNLDSLKAQEPTGITDYHIHHISVFPNPVSDLLTIETSRTGQYSITLNSLNGQMIYSGEMNGSAHHIDLSSFKNGVYFITIRSEDIGISRKIVIQ